MEVWRGAPAREPGGFPACSRGLSEATPLEKRPDPGRGRSRGSGRRFGLVRYHRPQIPSRQPRTTQEMHSSGSVTTCIGDGRLCGLNSAVVQFDNSEHKMKFISMLMTCSLLAGCSQSHTQLENPASAHALGSPAAAPEELPSNVKASISILLANRPYRNTQEVQNAVQVLHSFEESIPGIERTLQDVKSGEYTKEITHSFPKAGIAVTYLDGRVLGASRINQRTGTSNHEVEAGHH